MWLLALGRSYNERHIIEIRECSACDDFVIEVYGSVLEEITGWFSEERISSASPVLLKSQIRLRPISRLYLNL